MITTKLFEIRDVGTFIPAMAILVCTEGEDYLLRRSGFGPYTVILIHLQTGECQFDPYDWSNRTMKEVHNYIYNQFASLENEQVIDVEWILGIVDKPKVSERYDR
jgi:hypothetical protein